MVLLAIGSAGGSIQIWQLDNIIVDGKGTLLATLRVEAAMVCLRFSFDEKYLASCDDQEHIVVWDVTTHRQIRTLTDRNYNATILNHGSMLSFSKGCYRLLGRFDRTVSVWDAESGATVAAITLDTDSAKCCLNPDGTRFATTSGRDVHIWDTESGALLLELPAAHDERISSLCYSCDGRYLVAVQFDSSITVFDAIDGFLMKELSGHRTAILGCSFEMIDSESPRFATCCERTLKLWSVERSSVIYTCSLPADSSGRSVSFGPFKDMVTVGQRNGHVSTYDTQHGRLLFQWDCFEQIYRSTAKLECMCLSLPPQILFM
jgi:WD40 repeat protein